MAYRIAIVDDNAADALFMQSLLNVWASERSITTQQNIFDSAEKFLFHYADDKRWDILLLDIEMGAIDGVTMAKRVRQNNEEVQIIFVTGYPDYIAEGYEVAALHYLMKPVSKDKLFSVLDRAITAVQKSNRMIVLPVDGETLRLPITTVQYVEAFSHSVTVATESETISVKLSISEMERLLGNGFVKCHRSYLVGLEHIARLSKTEVTLDSGKTLPLSRNAAPIVHKAFISYYTGDRDENI